jgi:hypothetical protein
MYVDKTAEDQTYFDYLNSTGTARTNALNQIASGKLTAEQEASYSPEVTQNYYNESIRNPALREWSEITKPAISEQYAGPGYWGSARANAVTKGAGDLATNLAAERAKLAYDEQTSKRTAQEAALNRQTTAPSAYATEAATLSSASDKSRAIEQEKMLSEYQRWLSGETVNGVSNEAYNPYLQLIFQALGLSANTIATEGSSFGVGFGIGSSGGK